jgi:hypothetical protein
VKIIGKIDKGTEQIRICVHEWKAQVYCDIRLWYLKGNEYHPGIKGLRFNAELLPELRSALEEAERMIEAGEEVGDSREMGESQG